MDNYLKSDYIRANNHAFQGHIPERHKSKGSLKGKKAVRIDERTVIWVNESLTDKEISEIKLKYAKRI